MKVTCTRIDDIKIIEPSIFEDERGFFFESFNQKKLEDVIGHTVSFVQDNHSQSSKGVLRGLHYQLGPKVQCKLVHVIQGEVSDVAVDICQSSPTFGQLVGLVLPGDNKKQLWIPEGLAHGFIASGNTVEFLYKTTDYYSKSLERAIRWNDSVLVIDWQTREPPLISENDEQAPNFETAEIFA
jgi:dTDP-4-dehydrorhamnose 3,5-epimerase